MMISDHWERSRVTKGPVPENDRVRSAPAPGRRLVATPGGGWVDERSGDDRLSRCRTIMGLAGLTAVFGMGTGGAPPVSSPESGRGGGQAPPAAVGSVHPGVWVAWRHARVGEPARSIAGDPSRRGPRRVVGVALVAMTIHGPPGSGPAPGSWGAAADRGGQAARLLGPVGCGGRPPCTPGLSTWSSSRSLLTR